MKEKDWRRQRAAMEKYLANKEASESKPYFFKADHAAWIVKRMADAWKDVQMTEKKLEWTVRLRDAGYIMAKGSLEHRSPTYQILAVEDWVRVSRSLARTAMGRHILAEREEMVEVCDQVAREILRDLTPKKHNGK